METITQNIHFIAIGGSAMHNLALALHEKGHKITGSDDKIYEPSRSRLADAGILPKQTGWDPQKITKELDSVILGMHAKADNPELIRAQELGLKIYSFSEYIFEQSIDKQRIVISGSDGKTSITAMILHVLTYFGRKFDFVIGAPVEGMNNSVKLTSDAPIILIEGDEYIASPIDKSPQFAHYHPHIGLISGVAWDHINVYPTIDEYVKQFELFADNLPKGGILVYNEDDDLASLIGSKEREDVLRVQYNAHKHDITKEQTILIYDGEKIPLHIFGKHNMRNISGAKAVCLKIGISEDMFYKAIRSFKGATDRLEVLHKHDGMAIFKDFAHTPSKLKATTNAVKKQYSSRELTAVLELYSISSLNKDFLGQYKNTFKAADLPIVFYDPRTIEENKLATISSEDVLKAFNHPKLQIFTDKEKLKEYLIKQNWKNKNLLLMSSGNFGGMNLKELVNTIVSQN